MLSLSTFSFVVMENIFSTADEGERQDVRLHADAEPEFAECHAAAHASTPSRHPPGLLPRIPEDEDQRIGRQGERGAARCSIS